jgi:uncharacterized membrane protein YkgB
MPCLLSCGLATIFIIGMIFFHNSIQRDPVVLTYKKQLPSNLKKLYDEISEERLTINYQGYTLGLILSLLIIAYNYNLKHNKLTNTNMICIVISVSFLTNYFYYILSPKSKHMLEHINSPEQTKAWLEMYKAMQYYYHLGLVLGIIGVGILAFAFRC